MTVSGKKRVIIGNVLPSVDCGAYPAKVVIHEPFTICADIFTDGIHKIAAVVQIKHERDKQYTELILNPDENDRWSATYTPAELGPHFFQVLAWPDIIATWQESIKKKYEAGQQISVDLKEGAAIAQAIMQRAAGKHKKNIERWISELESTQNDQYGFDLSQQQAINEAGFRYRDKDTVTTHRQTFKVFAEPPKAAYSTWYELFPRSASKEQGKHGTFKDVIRLLPRIARMGFDILYLPPIHPIGLTGRKGKNNSLSAGRDDPGSPWAIGGTEGGHTDIHPQLGNLEDFKKLILAAKRLNIDIALDIAFQCSPDHPFVKEHPEWFKWRADGTVQFAENPPKKYEDILPLNFDSDNWQGLWAELKNIIEYWINKGVHVFRVDNPHTKALPFWAWVIDELKAKYPQLIFLSEAFTRPRVMEYLAKAGFTQSYTYFTWRHSKTDLQAYLTELTKTELQYYFRPNFWPNTPDILTPELVYGKENAHLMRLILAATMSSNYGLYAPVYELGLHEPMEGKEEYADNEKYELKNWDWTGYTRIREIIARINRIRKKNPALQSTNNIEFASTDDEHIICYVKQNAEKTNTLIMVVNLDPYHTHTANVTLTPTATKVSHDEHFTVHDLLSGEKYLWNGNKNFVSLNPFDMPAHILKVVKN